MFKKTSKTLNFKLTSFFLNARQEGKQKSPPAEVLADQVSLTRKLNKEHKNGNSLTLGPVKNLSR